MIWRPMQAKDEEVRGWMEKHGWPVTDTHYDFDREVYAWRHDALGGSHTLRMSQAVIEDTDAQALVGALDFWKAAELMREKAEAYTWLKRSPTGVVLEQLPTRPS